MLDQGSIPSTPSLKKTGSQRIWSKIRWISISWHFDLLLTFAQPSRLILCCCAAWPEHLLGRHSTTAEIFKKDVYCYNLIVTLILITLGKSCSFLCVTSHCVRWPELLKPIQEGSLKNYSPAKIFQFPLAEMLLHYLNNVLDTASIAVLVNE
jgi:hypothetical protein